MNKEMGKYPPKLLLDEHILVVTPAEKIMEYAVGEQRAVVTFNVKHFIPFAIQYFEDGKEHYGIVASKQLSAGKLQRRVENFWKASLLKN
jgi:hypothetical protein